MKAKLPETEMTKHFLG